jgi:hypothetical protein
VIALPSRLFWRALWTLCLLALPHSANFSRADTEDSKAPSFELHTADGKTVSGPLEQISEDWSISLIGGRADGHDVVSLRRGRLPDFPREPHAILANGDRLPGTPLQLTTERLRFQVQFGLEDELDLPLATVRVLWFSLPDGVNDGEAFRRRLASERRRRDVLYLQNGDQVEGTLTALNEKTMTLAGLDGRELKVERARAAALALNTSLVRVSRPRGAYARLVLAKGGRLSLVSARTDGRYLIGKPVFGGSVKVPQENISALDIYKGRSVYLSDLKPRRYEHTPYLGANWAYALDSSVAGHDLRLGGATYDKGIGLHSESRLTYDLAGQYQWFEALVGLDDLTGREGSVEIEVLVDGKAQRISDKAELTSTDKPWNLHVPVAGARELTLLVKFGRRGDVQDHVNWADARLLK